jgi:hypothetical protein
MPSILQAAKTGKTRNGVSEVGMYGEASVHELARWRCGRVQNCWLPVG